MSDKRMFPIIGGYEEKGPHPTQIPWEVAEQAYVVYSSLYGRSQSLERMAERGGMYPSELDKWLPGWRAMSCQNTQEQLNEAVRLINKLILSPVSNLDRIQAKEFLNRYKVDGGKD